MVINIALSYSAPLHLMASYASKSIIHLLEECCLDSRQNTDCLTFICEISFNQYICLFFTVKSKHFEQLCRFYLNLFPSISLFYNSNNMTAYCTDADCRYKSAIWRLIQLAFSVPIHQLCVTVFCIPVAAFWAQCRPEMIMICLKINKQTSQDGFFCVFVVCLFVFFFLLAK